VRERFAAIAAAMNAVELEFAVLMSLNKLIAP